MSVDQATQFIQRVQNDAAFRQRLEHADPGDRRAILTEEGYGDMRLSHLSAALPKSHGGELSDEEFAAVAGGIENTTAEFMIGTAVGVGVAAAAA